MKSKTKGKVKNETNNKTLPDAVRNMLLEICH